MDVDPAHAAVAHVAVRYQSDNLGVGHSGCKVHLLVFRQEFVPPPSAFPHEEFAINELVRSDAPFLKQSVYDGPEGGATGKCVNPN